jgi:tetratricopeptide (TPR) repeat protein
MLIERKFSNLQIFGILFLLALIIYSSSLKGPFICDDTQLIITNEYIKDFHTLPLLFNTEVFKSSGLNREFAFRYYRPLQLFSFAIDYFIWKMNPLGYHLTNVLIHVLMSFLVYYFLYQLFTNYSLALLSSVLFCVHPLQTESVSYIAGRSELLVSLFTLLTLVTYIDYVRQNTKRNIYLISLISFICALLSREAGFLFFVPFFILVMGLKSRISKSSLLFNFVSFLGILCIYILLRLTLLVKIQILPRGNYNLGGDLLNFLAISWEYLRLLIFPKGLHVLRMLEPPWLGRPFFVFLYLLFAISLLILIILALIRKKYVLLFGIAWFILSFIYLIRFMYKFSATFLTMEEHWIYLASIGFFVILAFLILSIPKNKLIVLSGILLIFTWGILTFRQNMIWANQTAFYRHNLKFIKPSLSYILYTNLIGSLQAEGRYEEALRKIDEGLLINPGFFLYFLQRGSIYQRMERYSDAEEAYREVLKIAPYCWRAHQELRDLMHRRGMIYQIEPDPTFSPNENKIMALVKMGEFGRAFELLDEDLQTTPTPNLYIIAGIALGEQGEFQEAIKAFNLALEKDPQNKRALHNLMVAYERMRMFDKIKELKKRMEELR